MKRLYLQIYLTVIVSLLAFATAAGAAAGLVAAAGLTRVLAGFVFGVTPGDPVSFAGAAMLLAVVMVAASAGPAWRASRVDPIVALRAE